MRKWVRDLKEGDVFDASPCAEQMLELWGGFGKNEYVDAVAVAAENLYFECECVAGAWEGDEFLHYVIYAHPHNLCSIKDCLVEIKEQRA